MRPSIEITPPARVHQQTAPHLFLLLSLSKSEAEMLRWHQQNRYCVEQLECVVSRSDLRELIQWALQQSYAPTLTTEEKLQLLDLAWNVQQLLWADDTVNEQQMTCIYPELHK
ncbi:MAG: hypothetical protein IGS54_25265 [Elainella sp. C42_A2020_010]|nr:hypothetical protein [Elainella sp. C42_A2020_010]RNJ69211.1 MAG: hypothetical protein EDM05_10115 [Leptolyngbya sp. IPPAS B-1204]